jgi:hypothetical protein
MHQKLFLILFNMIFIGAAFAQDSVPKVKRTYEHYSNVEHWSRDYLKLKPNGTYRLRHTTDQFRPAIKKGNWQIIGDTLITTQTTICQRNGVLKKATTTVVTEVRKFKIGTDGLYLYYKDGSLSDDVYFQ